jgi:hypothetical protein
VKLYDDRRHREKAVKMEIRPEDLKSEAEVRGGRILYIVVVCFGARFNNTCQNVESVQFKIHASIHIVITTPVTS